MFLDVRDFITAKYLKNEISKTRADEIIGVIEIESKDVKNAHEFQMTIMRLERTQFPELRGYFKAYRMKAGEWMDDMALEKIEKLIDQGKWKEAEEMMSLLEQMEK